MFRRNWVHIAGKDADRPVADRGGGDELYGDECIVHDGSTLCRLQPRWTLWAANRDSMASGEICHQIISIFSALEGVLLQKS